MNKKVNNFIYELFEKYELFLLFLQTKNFVHNLVEQKTKKLQNHYNEINKKLNENTIKKNMY
jgi:hypothetical protein